MEILNLPWLCIVQKNGQTSYQPQTKHAERMILPSSSQKNTHECTFQYMGAEKQTTKKVGFRDLSSSFSYKTLD